MTLENTEWHEKLNPDPITTESTENTEIKETRAQFFRVFCGLTFRFLNDLRPLYFETLMHY